VLEPMFKNVMPTVTRRGALDLSAPFLMHKGGIRCAIRGRALQSASRSCALRAANQVWKTNGVPPMGAN
jgi:hypothetical protein